MGREKKNPAEGKTQEELEREREQREEPEAPVYPPGDQESDED